MNRSPYQANCTLDAFDTDSRINVCMCVCVRVCQKNLAVVLATKRADLQGQQLWPKRTTGQSKKAKR